MMLASMFDRRNIAEMLHKAGADLDTQTKAGLTALMFAALHQSEVTAQYFVQHNCAVNIQDQACIRLYLIRSHNMQNGWTALMKASYVGNDEIIHILLKAGADPSLKSKVVVNTSVLSTHLIVVLQNGFTAKLIAQERNNDVQHLFEWHF